MARRRRWQGSWLTRCPWSRWRSGCAAGGCWRSAPGRAGMRPARPPRCCARPGWTPGPRSLPMPLWTARCPARAARCWRSPIRAPSGTPRRLCSARSSGAQVIQVCGVGVEGADLVTVPRERSSAYTASHLGALLRAAQLARALGAHLPGLGEVPAAVEDAYRRRHDDRPVPPARLIEFIGGGINQWTAAEGALKIREAAYVASEGLAVAQFLHGPSVALGSRDRLVCLDGGGPWSARI